MLNGEYGLNDICIGVPVIIGKSGVEEIIEINLTDNEKEKLHQSADSVKQMNSSLKNLFN